MINKYYGIAKVMYPNENILISHKLDELTSCSYMKSEVLLANGVFFDLPRKMGRSKETLLAEYIIVGQGAVLEHLFRDVLRVALRRFHVTSRFETLSISVLG